MHRSFVKAATVDKTSDRSVLPTLHLRSKLGPGRSGLARALGLSLILHSVVLSLLVDRRPEGYTQLSGTLMVRSMAVFPRITPVPAPTSDGKNLPEAGQVLPAAPVRGKYHHPSLTGSDDRLPALTSRAKTAAGRPSEALPPLSRPTEDIAPSAEAIPVSPDGLREYRWALGLQAGRLKKEYRHHDDALERRGGSEGRVELMVRVQGGSAPRVSLARGSGYPPLDERALELITRAVQETAMPTGLQGRDFSLPLLMEFRLDE